MSVVVLDSEVYAHLLGALYDAAEAAGEEADRIASAPESDGYTSEDAWKAEEYAKQMAAMRDQMLRNPPASKVWLVVDRYTQEVYEAHATKEGAEASATAGPAPWHDNVIEMEIKS